MGPCRERLGPTWTRARVPTPGLLGHAGRAGRAALPVGLAVAVHRLLVVPAHAEHDVRATRQPDDRLARLGVAGEDHAALGAVDPVREGVEVRLNVLRLGGRDLPAGAGEDPAGRDVLREHVRGLPGQRAAPVDVKLLAGRVLDAGLPVVGEEAAVLPQDVVGELLGGRRAVDLEPVLPADALVPAAEEEAGVVHVVIEVVVGEEEVVDVGGPEPGLDQLVGRGRAAVDHDLLAGHLDDVGRAEACRGRRGRASTEHVDSGQVEPP